MFGYLGSTAEDVESRYNRLYDLWFGKISLDPLGGTPAFESQYKLITQRLNVANSAGGALQLMRSGRVHPNSVMSSLDALEAQINNYQSRIAQAKYSGAEVAAVKPSAGFTTPQPTEEQIAAAQAQPTPSRVPPSAPSAVDASGQAVPVDIAAAEAAIARAKARGEATARAEAILAYEKAKRKTRSTSSTVVLASLAVVGAALVYFFWKDRE